MSETVPTMPTVPEAITAEQARKHEHSHAEAELYDNPAARQHAPVPPEAITAAHQAVYAMVDDAVTNFSYDMAGTGVASKMVRLYLRLAADTALEAAAPAIREADAEHIANLKAALRRFEHTQDLAQSKAVEIAVSTERVRVAELEQLAAEILGSFGKPAGVTHHEAYADDDQIAGWETTLKGPSS